MKPFDTVAAVDNKATNATLNNIFLIFFSFVLMTMLQTKINRSTSCTSLFFCWRFFSERIFYNNCEMLLSSQPLTRIIQKTALYEEYTRNPSSKTLKNFNLRSYGTRLDLLDTTFNLYD